MKTPNNYFNVCVVSTIIFVCAFSFAQNSSANNSPPIAQASGTFRKLVACRSNDVYYVGGDCASVWGDGDIGAQVNTAFPVAASSGNGVKLMILPGKYIFATPILLTGIKPITLECAPGGTSGGGTGTTILKYTGTTGTAVSWSAGANGGGMSGCTLQGSGPKYDTRGLFIDTIQGGVFSNLDISGFGRALEINSHANRAYIDTFNNMYVHENGVNLYTAPTGSSNENITFQGGVFFNRVYGAGCVNLSNFEIHFINVSFDSCPIALGGTGAHYSFIGSHFELTEGSTPIDFVIVSADCKACDVNFSDDQWVENAPNRSRTEFVTVNGSGNYSFIGEQVFAAEAIPQFASVNNSAANGTWCCGVKFGGGAITNIFNPNSTASGVVGLTLNRGTAFYQAKRATLACTTAAGIGGSCDMNVSWTTPFADSNYTVSCQGTGPVRNSPVLGPVTAKTNAFVIVRTVSLTASPSAFAAVDCIAVHD